MSRTTTVLQAMSQSKIIEVVLTAIVHAIYAAVIALSLFGSVLTAAWLLPPLVAPFASGTIGVGSLEGLRAVALIAATAALMLYAYLFVGTIVQAAVARLLSLGIGPGRYPAVSVTTLRWLIYSGIFTISMRTILPIIPVTFLTNLYFRIQGCRLGRGVRINSPNITDSYLLSIGDGVVIGGYADISCHLFEENHLILEPIAIGSRSLIGAHAYISPGVTIGRRCTIGLGAYLRRGKVIPDGAVVTSIAATDVHTARTIERSASRSAATSRVSAEGDNRRQPRC